jgi:hypothetical protein
MKCYRGGRATAVGPFEFSGKLIDKGLHDLPADAIPAWRAGGEPDAVVRNQETHTAVPAV